MPFTSESNDVERRAWLGLWRTPGNVVKCSLSLRRTNWIPECSGIGADPAHSGRRSTSGYPASLQPQRSQRLRYAPQGSKSHRTILRSHQAILAHCPDTTSLPAATWPSCIWSVPSLGSFGCEQILEICLGMQMLLDENEARADSRAGEFRLPHPPPTAIRRRFRTSAGMPWFCPMDARARRVAC